MSADQANLDHVYNK